MPQIKGGKLGNLRAVKEAAKRKSNDYFIKYVTNGLKVRFLEEPEEWFGFYEHYDQALKSYYPCVDDGCPGCGQEDRRTFRFLCNVIDLDDQKVVPLKLPKDLGNRLVVRYERYQTLLDRDYELLRFGEGLDTNYDVEASEPKQRNLSKFKTLDLGKVLDEAYNSVWGEDEEEEPTKLQKPKQKKAVETDEDWDDDDKHFDDYDDEDDEDDDEPFTDDEEVLDDDDEVIDDEDYYTEADLMAMPLSELRVVAKEYEVTVRKGMKKSELVKAIVMKAEG